MNRKGNKISLSLSLKKKKKKKKSAKMSPRRPQSIISVVRVCLCHCNVLRVLYIMGVVLVTNAIFKTKKDKEKQGCL